MWDKLGKQVQTFLLILIVVLLSVIMGVVGFGNPNAEGCAVEGPGYAARVYGETVTEGDFRAAYTVTGFNRHPTERQQTLRLRELTLDGLIERELLVREARRLGFTVDPDDVMRKVADEEVVLLSGPVDAPDGYPAGELRQSFRDRSGSFSAENLRRFIQYHLHRSVEEFVNWQVEETLANQVRDLVAASVSVSPLEVWDTYVQETERAKLSYVRFDPEYYAEQVEATDEAVSAWMAEHTEEVDTEYRRQRHRYTNLPEQTQARHILIAAAEGAPEDERAAARTRAEGLLAQLQGGADFAALAREHSTDEGSAARGGDLGWFPRGRMVPPFEEAAFGAEPGTLVDHLVESRFGFHIIEVTGRREGDVDEDVAKRELAEGLFRQARAGEMARADADRALAYLADGHTTDELDERLRDGWAEAPETAEGETAEGETAEGETAEGETDADLEALDDEEPPPARDPRAPQVRETRSLARTDSAIPGPFDSAPLTRAAFEMTLDDPLPEEPMQLGESWFVYRLTELTTAERGGMDDATRDRLERSLRERKRREVLSAYIGGLRAAAEADLELDINHAILSYGSGAADGEADESGEETAAN